MVPEGSIWCHSRVRRNMAGGVSSDMAGGVSSLPSRWNFWSASGCTYEGEQKLGDQWGKVSRVWDASPVPCALGSDSCVAMM